MPSPPRPPDPIPAPDLSRAYVALRRGGAPPDAAIRQLALPLREIPRLEDAFRRRAWSGRAGLPRFARHALHVRLALSAGGFPVLGPKARP